MPKHLTLALPLIAAVVASCAEGVEPDSSTEEAAVKRPDRNITFGTPIGDELPDLAGEGKEGRIKATDVARTTTHVINVKPVLEFPQPPAEHEPSPLVR